MQESLDQKDQYLTDLMPTRSLPAWKKALGIDIHSALRVLKKFPMTSDLRNTWPRIDVLSVNTMIVNTSSLTKVIQVYI